MTDLTTPAYWDGLKTAGMWPRLDTCYADRETLRVFDAVMDDKGGGRVLELGCGNSYWLPYWAQEYQMDVAGLDYAPLRLQEAKRNLTAVGFDGDLRCADIRNVQQDWIGRFDVVYSRGVVEHFIDPSMVLDIATSYLKPDGYLITTVPHLKGFWGNTDRRLAGFSEYPYVRMDLADLWTAHRLAGLRVVQSGYFRLLDPGVLNWSRTPKRVQWLVAHYLSLTSRARKWEPKNLPAAWYVDMFVVAKR